MQLSTETAPKSSTQTLIEELDHVEYKYGFYLNKHYMYGIFTLLFAMGGGYDIRIAYFSIIATVLVLLGGYIHFQWKHKRFSKKDVLHSDLQIVRSWNKGDVIQLTGDSLDPKYRFVDLIDCEWIVLEHDTFRTMFDTDPVLMHIGFMPYTKYIFNRTQHREKKKLEKQRQEDRVSLLLRDAKREERRSGHSIKTQS